MSKSKKLTTNKLVIGAMMTALVIIFQYLATYTTFFGPFSTAIALIPIVIGAAMCGTAIGAWLGFVFGFFVLITGGANLFLAYNVPGTLITVLVKGIACGCAAGIVNQLLKKFNPDVAAVASAIVCPIVNTGVFLLGCLTFFMPYADAIAQKLELADSGFGVFLTLATANFLFELGMNIVVSPIIVKILRYTKKA